MEVILKMIYHYMRAVLFIQFEDLAIVQMAQLATEEWAVALWGIQSRMVTAHFLPEWIPLLVNDWGISTLTGKE